MTGQNTRDTVILGNQGYQVYLEIQRDTRDTGIPEIQGYQGIQRY